MQFDWQEVFPDAETSVELFVSISKATSTEDTPWGAAGVPDSSKVVVFDVRAHVLVPLDEHTGMVVRVRPRQTIGSGALWAAFSASLRAAFVVFPRPRADKTPSMPNLTYHTGVTFVPRARTAAPA